MYETFVRAALAACARFGPGAYRVLLGDPAYEQDAGRRDFYRAMDERDAHFATLVEREVLDRGRRALLIAGGGHFGRVSDLPDGNVAQRLERSRPGTCAVVLPHYVFPDIAERREADLA